MIANFADPGNISADPNPDAVFANQFGVQIGIDAGVLGAVPYRGTRGGGLYNSTDALMLINTQYRIVNIRNGTEAFANFRRSGYPALTPNPVIGVLGSPGFARRLSYPDVEASANTANYQAAAAAIGGDKLTSRVFWDNP